jgi:hypothetical protein
MTSRTSFRQYLLSTSHFQVVGFRDAKKKRFKFIKMLCEFKLRSGDDTLKTAHIFDTNVMPASVSEICQTIEVPQLNPSNSRPAGACDHSLDCKSNQYCDIVERSENLHISYSLGSCKLKLSEDHECVNDDMCKHGLQCRATRFDSTKICQMNSSIGVNYNQGAEL